MTRNAPELQWNAGGWFGSTLGSTLWQLIAALVLVRLDPLLALFLMARTPHEKIGSRVKRRAGVSVR